MLKTQFVARFVPFTDNELHEQRTGEFAAGAGWPGIEEVDRCLSRRAADSDLTGGISAGLLHTKRKSATAPNLVSHSGRVSIEE